MYLLGHPAGKVGRRVDVVPRHVLPENGAQEHLADPNDLPGGSDVQQIDREHGEEELERGQGRGGHAERDRVVVQRGHPLFLRRFRSPAIITQPPRLPNRSSPSATYHGS